MKFNVVVVMDNDGDIWVRKVREDHNADEYAYQCEGDLAEPLLEDDLRKRFGIKVEIFAGVVG